MDTPPNNNASVEELVTPALPNDAGATSGPAQDLTRRSDIRSTDGLASEAALQDHIEYTKKAFDETHKRIDDLFTSGNKLVTLVQNIDADNQDILATLKPVATSSELASVSNAVHSIRADVAKLSGVATAPKPRDSFDSYVPKSTRREPFDSFVPNLKGRDSFESYYRPRRLSGASDDTTTMLRKGNVSIKSVGGFDDSFHAPAAEGDTGEAQQISAAGDKRQTSDTPVDHAADGTRQDHDRPEREAPAVLGQGDHHILQDETIVGQNTHDAASQRQEHEQAVKVSRLVDQIFETRWDLGRALGKAKQSLADTHRDVILMPRDFVSTVDLCQKLSKHLNTLKELAASREEYLGHLEDVKLAEVVYRKYRSQHPSRLADAKGWYTFEGQTDTETRLSRRVNTIMNPLADMVRQLEEALTPVKDMMRSLRRLNANINRMLAKSTEKRQQVRLGERYGLPRTSSQ